MAGREEETECGAEEGKRKGGEKERGLMRRFQSQE